MMDLVSKTLASRHLRRRGPSPRPLSGLPEILGRKSPSFRDPRLIAAVVLLFASVFAVAFHYYVVLSAEIDDRLKGSYLDNSVGILTSPFAVSPGDKLSIKELAEYLQAAGYQQQAKGEGFPEGGSFSIDGNEIQIAPGRVAASQLGIKPVSLDVENDHVASIRHGVTGKQIDSALIEGELLVSVRDGDRRKKIPVEFDALPDDLRNAVIAVEDRRFFAHSGIDWRGIGRALWRDINEGEIVQGGSTITQQIIKNSFLSADRTFDRKLKEAAMALILESRLSKEEIFTLYCNEVYLGQSGTFAIHGLGEAAQAYFDKNVADLTLSESAFLAGLIHAPNRYSLQRDMTRAIERRNTVLDSMVEIGAITSETAEAAKREQLVIKSRKVQNDYGASYFIDYAQRYIDQRYGAEGSSLPGRIYTTMDPRLQRAAYEAVTSQAEKLDKLFARPSRKGGEAPRVQAALVAMDAHTGEVLAMVGGRNYDESQLNRATDARRQPGSTFKPFVYAGALAGRSFTAATMLSDRPQTFTYDGGRAEYKPTNYHGGYSNRDVTLREALARSLNIPAVELAMRVGLTNVADLAEECGLKRPASYPSMALGASEVTPLEIAGAYTAFANEGMALRPAPIKSILATHQSGAIEKRAATGARAFSPQVAYLMTNMMQSVVDAGTASRLRSMGLRGAIAGKTGTSNDGWFVGYTPGLVCAVWVGFDDNHDLKLKSSESALLVWADFMKQALEMCPRYGGNEFVRPSGIVTVDIDPATGYAATPQCASTRNEIFIAGTEPYGSCSCGTMQDDLMAETDYLDSLPLEAENADYSKISLDICSESGLIATSNCPQSRRRTFDLGNEPLDTCRKEHSEESYPDLGEPPVLNPPVDGAGRSAGDKSAFPNRRNAEKPKKKPAPVPNQDM
ncbi:MAG TPA: PBP1A family penicillin-binding protein [Blastocatellia bacterium]|nr:PBP1A family penicillin-binding protein [Blastocatellia bacterium]